eukprot:scaffold80165_cov63-Cyclotella_meneghiniana.AAC.4
MRNRFAFLVPRKPTFHFSGMEACTQTLSSRWRQNNCIIDAIHPKRQKKLCDGSTFDARRIQRRRRDHPSFERNVPIPL